MKRIKRMKHSGGCDLYMCIPFTVGSVKNSTQKIRGEPWLTFYRYMVGSMRGVTVGYRDHWSGVARERDV